MRTNTIHVDQGEIMANSGPISLREHVWLVQVWNDFWLKLTGDVVATGDAFTTYARFAALAVGTFMLFFSIYVFVDHVARGILLLSPPLLATFLGGLAGIRLTTCDAARGSDHS